MKRHWVSTLIAMLFATLAVTGVMGFFFPFHLLTVSVHSLVGFVFIAAVGLHIRNHYHQLRQYFTRRSALMLGVFVVGLITVILWQPPAVTAIIGLSNNLGPDPGRSWVKQTRSVKVPPTSVATRTTFSATHALR